MISLYKERKCKSFPDYIVFKIHMEIMRGCWESQNSNDLNFGVGGQRHEPIPLCIIKP